MHPTHSYPGERGTPSLIDPTSPSFSEPFDTPPPQTPSLANLATPFLPAPFQSNHPSEHPNVPADHTFPPAREPECPPPVTRHMPCSGDALLSEEVPIVTGLNISPSSHDDANTIGGLTLFAREHLEVPNPPAQGTEEAYRSDYWHLYIAAASPDVVSSGHILPEEQASVAACPSLSSEVDSLALANEVFAEILDAEQPHTVVKKAQDVLPAHRNNNASSSLRTTVKKPTLNQPSSSLVVPPATASTSAAIPPAQDTATPPSNAQGVQVTVGRAQPEDEEILEPSEEHIPDFPDTLRLAAQNCMREAMAQLGGQAEDLPDTASWADEVNVPTPAVVQPLLLGGTKKRSREEGDLSEGATKRRGIDVSIGSSSIHPYPFCVPTKDDPLTTGYLSSAQPVPIKVQTKGYPQADPRFDTYNPLPSPAGVTLQASLKPRDAAYYEHRSLAFRPPAPVLDNSADMPFVQGSSRDSEATTANDADEKVRAAGDRELCNVPLMIPVPMAPQAPSVPLQTKSNGAKPLGVATASTLVEPGREAWFAYVKFPTKRKFSGVPTPDKEEPCLKNPLYELYYWKSGKLKGWWAIL